MLTRGVEIKAGVSSLGYPHPPYRDSHQAQLRQNWG